MLYTKPYLSLRDQLNLVKSRGLQVANDADAMEWLHRTGYYRLSAYWYPFRAIAANRRSDVFLPDSRFEDAVNLCRFDKELKLLLLDALERVEIAVRVEIALRLGRLDPFAHERPDLFRGSFTSSRLPSGRSTYDEWMDKFNKQVTQSRDDFILRYENEYGSRSPLPIWIAIELWDFGLLGYAFSGIQYRDQVAIAARFSVPDWQLMDSWLRSLNYVRNVIAHHGRLWNLNLSQRPKLPKKGEIPDFDGLLPLRNVGTRIYSICCILCSLTYVIDPQSPWFKDLKGLVRSFPIMPHASSRDMGFPVNWESHAFWNYT